MYGWQSLKPSAIVIATLRLAAQRRAAEQAKAQRLDQVAANRR
jgi:hypothetical protein